MLSMLAIISFENEGAQSIDCDKVVNTFSHAMLQKSTIYP